MSSLSLHDKLVAIQQELVAPKSERNDFGGFNYRNIEKINEALKPHLKTHGLLLSYTDELVAVSERYYIKATAKVTDGTAVVQAIGYAREAAEHTKKDEAQLTGGASSYARKYAISGLFALDDGSHDPDSKDNDRSNYSKPAPQKNTSDAPATVKQKLLIDKLYKQKIANDGNLVDWLLSEYGMIAKAMRSQDASAVIEDLMAKETEAV